MNLDELERIKRLALFSLFSDDDLMNRLVLKGGNALDLVHKIASRASLDLDFSIDSDFSEYELADLEGRIRYLLETNFKEHGYVAFDVKLEEKPPEISADMEDFWGGYSIKFKIIEEKKYAKIAQDIDKLRRNATVIGTSQKKVLTIDISKFEYCKEKMEKDLDGLTIYVYPLEMIIIEKLRAICQQMNEYRSIVRNPSRSARARDFFDICTILERHPINLTSRENILLMEAVFAAKRVPLKFLGKIKNYREYHRPDFDAVKATVKPDVKLQDFDYYFDFVLERVEDLKPFWKV